MSKLRGLADLVQEVIDKGATSVEQVHKAVMNQPLDVLERIAPLQEPAKLARELQERIIGGVYDVIRKVNEEVGAVAKELLSRRSEADTAEGEGD